ncbi:hypothetical protein KC909_00075 [Candidatus Dojkabacteria bacterium]|uniref:Uncharacterized protein n=1 Tax=Candidatus Dojkabacteria bacterium TaxID=2099670 RepID=A0A955RIU9_9BACT|nr:hypothetical protein [Candidatus Dojkabacteria bacterium]
MSDRDPRKETSIRKDIMKVHAGGAVFDVIPFHHGENDATEDDDNDLLEDLADYIYEYVFQANQRWPGHDAEAITDAAIDSLAYTDAAYALRFQGHFIGLMEFHTAVGRDGNDFKEVSTVLHPQIYAIEGIDTAHVSGELFAGTLATTVPGELVHARVNPSNTGSLMLVTGLVPEVVNAESDFAYQKMLRSKNPYYGAEGFDVEFAGLTGIDGSIIYRIKVPASLV